MRAAATQDTNDEQSTESARPSDPIAALKARSRDALLARLGNRLYDASLSPTQLNQQVVDELGKVLEDEVVPLTATERLQLVAEISDDVLGYGPIERFLLDPTVTEIMVNGCDAIYVERAGKLHRTDERFGSDARLRQVIDKIVAAVGRRIDESSPMVDARLADGSRVNAVIPPLAVDGPALTIRKFAKHRLQTPDLINFGTLTPESAEFISACVAGRLNIMISGGTGTGKTTLLNVMSSMIPNDDRIVTIEDAAELQLDQEHLVRLESRPENIEGRGGVAIRDLVRNALRMRPDRIIVGEVRGAETLDMLQAMNTGHDGSLSTVHANSPRDALFRLETMTLMAGMDLPLRAIRDQIASALDLVVHLSRLRDGSRRVTQISEVAGAEGDVVSLSDLFAFDYSAGLDDEGRHRGSLAPTGLRPGFAERLRDAGIELPARLLGIGSSNLARPGARR
ncbi:MAG: CpaF family protein [Acidimicrobiia bacterium]